MNTSTANKWREVNRQNPCPECGKPDWCRVAPDGAEGYCNRQSKRWGGQGVQRKADVPSWYKPWTPERKAEAKPETDWADVHTALAEKLTPERLAALAEATGVPAEAWAKLRPGWATREDLRAHRAGGAGWAEDFPDGAWAFPEVDGSGKVVGLSLRAADGRKGFFAGASRGIVVPDGLHDAVDGVVSSVLVVEGASDVAAAVALGLPAVGRPSNTGGTRQLAKLLRSLPVIVLGERDAKPGGAWPGRDGAMRVAAGLAAEFGEPVSWSLPPAGYKDLRAAYVGGMTDGAAVADAVNKASKRQKPRRKSVADVLARIAREKYELGQSSDGEAFVVARDGPPVVRLIRGGGLRAELARAYRAETGKIPPAGAIADVLSVLEGEAADAPREPLWVRVGPTEDGPALDLGRPDGASVRIRPGGWAVRAVSTPRFRRTALCGALPEPAEGSEPVELCALRSLLNLDDESWPLLVGWLVAALFPDIPHPVLMLGGEQGSGKSSAARMLAGLIDASPAPLRAAPKDPEAWAIAAAGSWVVCLDNVSGIPGWLSDTLCKAVTGDGLVRRKLYSDGELVVSAFRRCVILTSIDPGALRGDLADRLLLLDLQRIPEEGRRTEAEIDEVYRQALPLMLGGLASAVSRVLAVLPDVKLDGLPRMADFARVLAALDVACPELTGGRAFKLFAEQRRRIVDDVLESDGVAVAIRDYVERVGDFTGSAGELLAAITPLGGGGKYWPDNPRRLVGHLKRIAPALRAVGVVHTPPEPHDKSRTHRIAKTEVVGNVPPIPPVPPEAGAERGAA